MIDNGQNRNVLVHNIEEIRQNNQEKILRDQEEKVKRTGEERYRTREECSECNDESDHASCSDGRDDEVGV